MLGPLTYGAVSQVSAVTPWYLSGGAPAPIAVYEAKGAASQAASYVNIVNPGTNDAAPGAAPTWAVGTGWTFNGTTQYLATGITVAAGYSILVRFSGAAAGVGTVIGASNSAGTAQVGILPNNASGVFYYYGGGVTIVSPGLAAGVLATAGNQGYRNGSADGAAISGSSFPAFALFIGARNLNGSANRFYSGNVQYVVVWDSTLSGPQVAAVSAAVAAL